MGLASWDLYRQLPAGVDAKRRGGGGKGRDREEIQEDTLGTWTMNIFQRAVAADVVTRSEALTYLDVPDTALDRPDVRDGIARLGARHVITDSGAVALFT